MPMTFFVAGLVGLLTGTRFRAVVLILGSAAAFAATLCTGLVAGYSLLCSLAAAFALIFTLQFLYLTGIMLVVGRTRILRRLAVLAVPHEELPRRG